MQLLSLPCTSGRRPINTYEAHVHNDSWHMRTVAIKQLTIYCVVLGRRDSHANQERLHSGLSQSGKLAGNPEITFWSPHTCW